MSDGTRRIVGSAGLALGLAVLYVILLLTALHEVGTDDALYYSEQMKAGILPASGISDGDLRMLDGALADYLAGDAQALEQPEAGDVSGLRVEVFGRPQPAFNEREMIHMRDCYDLFRLLRGVRRRLVPWAVLLIAGGAYVLRDRRRARLCAWLSPLILLIPLGIFAVCAMSDFDAAFNFFHRVLFRNDLWLLDPRTDLLIRICPESMFMAMGARIGIYGLIAMLAVSVAAGALTFIRPKGKGENAWKTTTRRASAQKRITFGKTDMR